MRLNSFRNRTAGFSLIEIVLAVGIISFALVGIIGLLPAAINSALESQRQTQAALIAKRIFTDLSSQKPFIQKEAGMPKESDRIELTTKAATKVTYDEGGMLPGLHSNQAAATTGGAVYEAAVEITPDTPLPGLAKAQVDISTPVGASSSHRSTYRFVSLLDVPLTVSPTP